MATYNKRGYKAPKPKEEKEKVDFENQNDSQIDVKESVTAEVFSTLDEKANKTEEWIIKNQKTIFTALGAIAITVLGYFAYTNFFLKKNEEEAFSKMFQAQSYFQKAVDATEKQDSLFKLAIKGGEGKLGLEGIIKNHEGTAAANLAQYELGIAYLNLKNFNKAIEHLDNFSTKDNILKAQALGAKGDANSELKKYDEALKLYVEAAKLEENDFITPRFLNKAATICISQNKKEEALKYLEEIKDKYETSSEGYTVDAIIASLKQ